MQFVLKLRLSINLVLLDEYNYKNIVNNFKNQKVLFMKLM